MHATHQFFLSKRSLYVLVLDQRRDDKAEYWLRHIESFGGNSPILIVLNKQDANPGFDLDRRALLRKYPGIKGFYRTSCHTSEGVAEFRAALISELVQVPMIETRWPKSWFQVKELLEKVSKPYLSCDEYEAICDDAGITEQKSQEVLVDFLHDLGVAVHFKNFALDDTHVLDPKWVTNAVYKIINAKQVATDGGILRLDSLREILKQRDDEAYCCPRSKHNYIVELMKQFRLCYSLSEEAALIPQLLPVAEPDFPFDYAGSLKFVLHYHDFLPLSIFPRFMVRIHQDIKADLRWRTGVVLENKESGSSAVVRADNETRKISIFVNGLWCKDYFAVILLCFREINTSFEKLKISELVPMPDDPERTARYATLLKLAEKGMDDYLPDDSDKVYSVKDLLGLVQFNEEDSGQEKIFDMLEKIDDQLLANEKSFTEQAQNILDLKPSFFGITLNVNALFDTLSNLYKKWQNRPVRKDEHHQ